MPTRIERLVSLLSDGVDAALVESPVNRRYLTEFASSDGLLICGRGWAFLFVDGRYVETAKEQAVGCEVVLWRADIAVVRERLISGGVKTVAVESSQTVARYRQLQSGLQGLNLEADGELDRRIASLREIKDQKELCALRCAGGIADKAFQHILGFIREGVTERGIAWELDFYMRKQGSQQESFETIVVSGPRGSRPHGVPGDRVVRRGDLITMDFGAVVDGYHSDMTRTVAVGEANHRQREIYDTVLRAQHSGLAALRAGVRAADVDQTVRGMIEQTGYGDRFTHSTGHGVGLEVHEAPTLSSRSEQILSAGHVVTVEPGIYLEGELGVRIEDFAVVTDRGYEALCFSPKELLIL